jgi:hypothetical protein
MSEMPKSERRRLEVQLTPEDFVKIRDKVQKYKTATEEWIDALIVELEAFEGKDENGHVSVALGFAKAFKKDVS